MFHFGILVVGFSVDDDFNLIQPSLIQQLRTILDQYPDDGQILKVKKAQAHSYINIPTRFQKRCNLKKIYEIYISSCL